MRRTRNTVCLPGINKELKQIAAPCYACQKKRPRNQKEPLQKHEEGKITWEKLGLDFFEFGDRHYLIIVDYFSNFIEVKHMTSTTASHTIGTLKQQYRIPKLIISDNRPQFTAEKFKEFTKRWNIVHNTSSSGHPQSNSKAESVVKTIKYLMKRFWNAETDPYEGLKNTPRQGVGHSPEQIMFRRSSRTLLLSKAAACNIY
ncbi:hypothetical protein RRG08_001876 [Elysia crispata]|uniref:Integrase catalytic domain-containing protein n=1 Tax=Elysia crispata TaxID=231223 RepID=A0AAE1A502_9GAST|nr:hypothetical protein RRG08_001876 [Elysia crispata]